MAKVLFLPFTDKKIKAVKSQSLVSFTSLINEKYDFSVRLN